MTCMYCKQPQESVYALYRKNGELIGHADYRCLFGTYHPEWCVLGDFTPRLMPYRCVLVER